MGTTARLRAAAAFLVVTVAAACGSDSTAPPYPASVARHFDSLYVDAAARGDTSDAYANRALLLTFLELPPALGASPATLTVTTATGIEHWRAFEFDDILSASDSGFALLAYRETAAHTVLLLEFDGNGHVQDGALITNDTLNVQIAAGSATTSLTSTSASCGTPSPSLLNPQLGTLQISSCTLAKFLSSLSITTQTAAQVDPALASLSFNAATINGVRVVEAAQAATLRRMSAALHAAHAHKRF